MILVVGLIIPLGIFSVSSGWLTGLRKPAGVVFLFSMEVEFIATSLILTIVIMILHVVWSVSFIKKIRKD